MECEYCNQVLKTPSALKKHQNTTKYCLVKQNKVPSVYYNCSFCGTSFTLKTSLHSHLKICKAKDLEDSVLREKKLIESYEKTIKELREEIAEYKKDMFRLASKPNHINNIGNTKNITKTQNLVIADWRPDIIEEKVEENFKLEHIEDGIKGVARFASQYITHGDGGVKCYQCTDSNREVFMYKDSNGVLQKDIRARKLKDAIKEPILKKTAELSIEEYSRLSDLAKGNNIDVVDVSNNKMVHLSKKTQEIKNIEDSGDFSREMAILST